jgi:hypothetical protein
MRMLFAAAILCLCGSVATADEPASPNGTKPVSIEVTQNNAANSAAKIKRISRISVLSSASLLVTSNVLFNLNFISKDVAEVGGSLLFLTGVGVAIIAPSFSSFHAKRPGLGFASMGVRSLTFLGMGALSIPLLLGGFRSSPNIGDRLLFPLVLFGGEATLLGLGLTEGVLAAKPRQEGERELSFAPFLLSGSSKGVGVSAHLRW